LSVEKTKRPVHFAEAGRFFGKKGAFFLKLGISYHG
jgi:hypothetical protein